jgi:hypothetical protein
MNPAEFEPKTLLFTSSMTVQLTESALFSQELEAKCFHIATEKLAGSRTRT